MSNQAKGKARDSLQHIITNLQGPITIPKLMNLQFISDYKHRKRFNEQITNITYIKNNRGGTHSEELQQLIQTMADDGAVIIKGQDLPCAMRFIKPRGLYETEYLTRHETETIANTCDKYGDVETENLEETISSFAFMNGVSPNEKIQFK